MFGTARLVFGLYMLPSAYPNAQNLTRLSRIGISQFSDRPDLISIHLNYYQKFYSIFDIWAIIYTSSQVLRKHPVYSTQEYPVPFPHPPPHYSFSLSRNIILSGSIASKHQSKH